MRRKIVEALTRGRTKSETARAFSVSCSSVKRYAKLVEQGRPLAPNKRPGSKPKMDQHARRLLQADLQERPAATLSQRRDWCTCHLTRRDFNPIEQAFSKIKSLW